MQQAPVGVDIGLWWRWLLACLSKWKGALLVGPSQDVEDLASCEVCWDVLLLAQIVGRCLLVIGHEFRMCVPLIEAHSLLCCGVCCGGEVVGWFAPEVVIKAESHGWGEPM